MLPGELRHQRAHGTGSTRHHHDFTGVRPPGFCQAKPGRSAGHAEHAQGGADRGQSRVELAQRAVVAAGMGLPAKHALDPVAWRQQAGMGGDDAAHHARVLHGVQRVRIGVVGRLERLVDAHVGVDAEVPGFDQHLAVRQVHRQGAARQFVMLRANDAGRVAAVNPFLVQCGRGVHENASGWLTPAWSLMA